MCTCADERAGSSFVRAESRGGRRGDDGPRGAARGGSRRPWAVLLAAALAAGAGPSTVAAEEVSIQVWAIRATKSNAEISPELRAFAEKLRKDFNFTGYKLEKKAGGSAEVGKSFKTGLIGAYSAEVTPTAVKGGTVTLRVQVLEKRGGKVVPKVSTTVSLSGGRFQLVGGPGLPGGDVLIVAVAAR